MATLDAGIYNAFSTPARSVADYDRDFADAENAKVQQQTNLLGLTVARQKADEYSRGVAEQGQIRNALATLGPTATDDQRIGVLKGLGTQSGFAAADALDKSRLERLKTTAAAGKDLSDSAAKDLDTQIRVHDFHAQKLATVQTPEQAVAWANEGNQLGLFKQPGQFEAGMSELQKAIQAGPDAFAAWKQRAMQGGMSVMQQLQAQREAAQQTETARHNTANERNAAGELGVAQGNLGLRAKELAYNQSLPKGVLVQTDNGPVIANPRDATALPITVNGQPVAAPGPKLKEIPQAANKAILENSQNLTKVQQAIDLLEGNNVGEMTGDKSATGFKDISPNGILNRVDPKGVDTRAAISDIGSLILHDRSGAAVTASETPRLLPFIPLSTDDNATAAKKLRRFKQLYESEANGLNEQYGPDSGYKGRIPTPATTSTSKVVSSDIFKQADAILGRGK